MPIKNALFFAKIRQDLGYPLLLDSPCPRRFGDILTYELLLIVTAIKLYESVQNLSP